MFFFENACALGPAASAATAFIERPGGDLVPVTADNACATGVTIGALPRLIMNIARVNVAQPGALRNFTCKSERGGRCSRHIAHLPVRMKCREMERHIGA